MIGTLNMEGRSANMEHIHIVKTGITELDVDCVVKNLHIVQSID